MSKIITIKLTVSGPNVGPFTIKDEFGNVIAIDVPKKTLVRGISYTVNDNVNIVVIESTGKCKFIKAYPLSTFDIIEYANIGYTQTTTACLWRHLTNITIYNEFYGQIDPYIIEYPFAFQYQDQVLQNVKDYTKVYEYLSTPNGVFDDNIKVEVNDKYFNKAVLYNGQQSSGVLKLVSKPINNLQAYGQYPIYGMDSKTITFTKSDNFYQYNTFWALQKNSQAPLFKTSCESLSIDKIVNQDNMDYSVRSFRKAPLRAKELKIRHILDNSSTTHLVSQFITNFSQISYK